MKFKRKHIVLIIVVLILAFFLLKKNNNTTNNDSSVNNESSVNLIKGKETVNSVKEKLHNAVYNRLKPNLEQHKLTNFPKKLLFLIFKEEQVFEIYFLKNGRYYLLKKYNFTGFSGSLGPKLKEGDRQIPEGVYTISYLNPNSSYHLSLKVNYPNTFDKQKAKTDGRTNLGGDIFIHGKNVTIGCVPLGDIAIEEVFLLAEKAINNQINVIISPRDFRQNKPFPTINSITWEDELYQQIKAELKKYKF